MGYINASTIAQYPPNLNRYQQVADDASVLWLEKAQSGKVSMEDIKEALAEFIKLFKAGMASKAETLTLARAFPNSLVYTNAARKQSEENDTEPVVVGGPASISLVDREGHLITTGALERAFKRFMDNDRTRNVMVLHSDVQVGWALPAYISKGGQIFKSGVNDNGLFFICELRDDTSIAKKVADQIHKGMLKSYSIAGSATKIQNMTKGLVPYLQVDDMELAEVTICEKGVNQGAGFEILKAEMPLISTLPSITKPMRKMIMHSNNDGTINFSKSFAYWMQKEKDPLTTKESFVTLHNEAGRRTEHEQLMREYGFPSEQSFETMRYVPVVEVETDDDGIPIHNLPPWVVNEAGEALGDRLDEDAPDYHKSDKAKARQKAGSAQKMFLNFMGKQDDVEKARSTPKDFKIRPKGRGGRKGAATDKPRPYGQPLDTTTLTKPKIAPPEEELAELKTKMFYNFMGIELEKADRPPWRRRMGERYRRFAEDPATGVPKSKLNQEYLKRAELDRKQAANPPTSPVPGIQTHPVRSAPTPMGKQRNIDIANKARDDRARNAAIRDRQGSAIGQDTPDPTAKDYSRGTPTGFTPGEGGRTEREASGNPRPQDFGGEAPKDFTPGRGRREESLANRPTGKFGAPQTERKVPASVQDRARKQRWNRARGESFKGGAEARSKLMGQLRRTGQNIAQGGREFRSGLTGTTPKEGRTGVQGKGRFKTGGVAQRLGRMVGSGAGRAERMARSGVGGIQRGYRAGNEQRQGWGDSLNRAAQSKPDEAAQSRPPGRQLYGSLGRMLDRRQAAKEDINKNHQRLGIGEGKIFSHPDFHGLDHAQQRAQVRESMMQRGGKTLEDHLKNYQHLVGNYPSGDKVGDKIGHVTVNSLPEGHHAGTPMDNNQFHQLIQDGHVGFEPTPEYANSNWRGHKAHVDSHIRDASHIPPAIEGAAPQTQIPQGGAAATPGAAAIGPSPTQEAGAPTPGGWGAPAGQPKTGYDPQGKVLPAYQGMSLDKMLTKALGAKKRVNR